MKQAPGKWVRPGAWRFTRGGSGQPVRNRLGWKDLPGTNTSLLPTFNKLWKKKSFITLAPGVNVMKLLLFLTDAKLECFVPFQILPKPNVTNLYLKYHILWSIVCTFFKKMIMKSACALNLEGSCERVLR